ncbi:MAG: hypothetical protein GWP19_01505 [Planctomycetia bacterium]|nr:hypothetical protein [Planctomycetia bacterium]
MAFAPHGSLNPQGAPVLKREIITNSVASTVFQSLKLSSGFLALGTTGALVFGHLLAHTTELGVGLNTTGAAGAAMGSYANTYTVASDNQTVAKVKAECDVSKMSLYTVDPDATIGTTTGSDLSGYKADIADQDNLDESTAATTTLQYNLWGVDPNDSGNAIVNIFESQVFGV